MTYIHAVILGIIQGAGEFLPISSSGHLIALPKVFGWPDHGLEFDIALHWGTLFAVLLYFGRDWIQLIKAGFSKNNSSEKRMFWYLIMATIPGAVMGYLLEDVVEHVFRNLGLVGITLISMGIVLYISDHYGKNKVSFSGISWKQALGIGCSQALAIIPGVSRSGITISCARMFSIDRESAARFSFLLSTPIIFGSAAVPLKNFFQHGLSVSLGYFVVGSIVSGLVGLACIAFLLRYLRKADLSIFAWYRFVVGTYFLFIYFRQS